MVATNTTTTTVTSTANRTGTGIVVDSQSNTVTVGNFVTDVSLQPFITNRIISVFAFNMRPSRRLHVFFDSINVDQYCAPGARVANTYPTPVGDTSDYTIIARGGNWGAPIYSDEKGRVAFQFNIPAGKFKTGDRSIQIADVDSLVYGNDAITTLSSSVFTASNLSVSKQNVTLTTVNADLNFIPISNTVVTSTTSVATSTIGDNITRLPPPPPPPPMFFFMEPIAQSLTITTPQGEAGIYVTSIDIFFRQKSLVRENGVMVYLCETKNGYPDGSTVLPFGRVHKTYDEVNVSENGTVPTTFTFPSPVFLNNGLTYAFVVKPDANDQDYQVFTAFLGDTDLSTGYQVFSQPVLGTAFYGATDLQWTALQKEYIKFTLKRAQFNKNAGEAYFYNSNTEYVTMLNMSYVNTSVGILSGDYIFQSTNAVTNSTGGSVNTSVRAVVDFYDSVKGIIYCDKSTGNFLSNTYAQIHRFANGVITPNNSTYIASGNTGLLYNPVIDALVPQLAVITPAGTALNHTYVGTSNVYTIDANERKVNIGYENEFYDQERIVASKSNEMANMSSNKSLQLKSYFRTDSEFLSPAIDTVRYQQLVIKNDVDPVMFNYGEYFNSGNTKSKYISQIVTLAPGQDAEDLQVILTAFRPVNSDIEVWVKFLNGEDTDQISQKTWTPLYNAAYDVYSDPSNPNDFREYVFKVGSYYGSYLANGTITTTTASTTVTGNNTFFSRDLKPGWFINLNADNSKKIISIASNTSLTIESAFANNHTNEAFYLVPPYTTPWLSSSSRNQLSGTVSTYTTNNSIVGVGTSFTTQLKAGNIIEVDGDSQTIVYIANNTLLGVGTPWSSNNSGANGYIVSPNGVTYYNNNLNLYSSFKQFQIKVILKSNDSSKVPFIDDLRALALQL